MPERRYTDEEISTIFSKAVEGPSRAPLQSQGDDGLSLAELQQIGREVGIEPGAIARAARSLDAPSVASPRRLLGLPVGVERTVDLGRRVTDAESERIVVRLREVFDARGTLGAHGSFRQWTNGNLQALLEPTANGHRLRLRTTKGSARAGVSVGLAALGMGAVVSIAAAAGGHLVASLPGVLTMALTGAGMIAYGVLPLPRWAKLRASQMEAIAASVSEPAEPGSAEL